MIPDLLAILDLVLTAIAAGLAVVLLGALVNKIVIALPPRRRPTTSPRKP